MLADIDVYFKNDELKANGLVDAIANAGCRFLKGAILARAELCTPSDEKITYYNAATGHTVEEAYHDIIARHLVPLDVLSRVFSRGRSLGLLPILSVYDEQGISFALSQGAAALKIPSSNVVHAPLIRSAAQTGLPLLLDTGRSTLAEIDRAVSWIKQAVGNAKFIVEHSPPGPPAGAEKFHMRMLPFLAERFACPVGLSDHAIGFDMLPVAVALGASIVEKGLVDDDASPDIDVAHAMPKRDLWRAVTLCNTAWQALGTGPRPELELPKRSVDRMGLVALKDLKPGDRVDLTNVGFAFPPLGIPVEHWDTVKDQVVQSVVAAGTPLYWELLGLEKSKGASRPAP